MSVRTAGRARLDGTLAEGLRMPVLGQAEAREAVLGQVARYWTPRPAAGPAASRTPEGFARFAEPGWAKAALSLQLTPLPGGRTLLAAETRVLATDLAARRAFARYWRLIRAGGARPDPPGAAPRRSPPRRAGQTQGQLCVIKFLAPPRKPR